MLDLVASSGEVAGFRFPLNMPKSYTLDLFKKGHFSGVSQMSTNQRFNIIAIFFFQSMFLVKWQMYDFINFCWECICVNKFMMLFLVKVTFILCDDFLSSRLMVTVFTVFILHFVQIKSEKHQTQVPLLCQVIRKHLFPYWHRETQVSKMQFLFCLLL